MLSRSFDDIAEVVLGKKQVYSLDVDSRIREAADRLTARAFFEFLSRLDDREPRFGEELEDLCRSVLKDDTYLIGFDDGTRTGDESEVAPEEKIAEAVYYLRLVFVDADAAYYQFPLFPDLDRDYIVCAGRKRSGEAQYIRLELTEARFLKMFIEECRRNPHFVRVEECSAEECRDAPSNAV